MSLRASRRPTAPAERPSRAFRPRPAHDPWRYYDQILEDERQTDGRLLRSRTVFLVGSECPFPCSFCDLWQYTTPTATPAGAIPAQITQALADDPTNTPLIKLYNASNFFEKTAVPPSDDAEILQLLRGFEKVVVECHAKLLGPRAFDFADRLAGRLQIAMGWETAHAATLAALNKGLELRDLQRAGHTLRERGIHHRAFVLMGLPGIPVGEESAWVERTCECALEAGAEQVVLIPLRRQPGAPAAQVELSLEQIAATCQRCARLDANAILIDLWDLERFGAEDPERAPALRNQLAEFQRWGRFPG